MTSLGVALAVDARGPCAMYIITDSRITWSDSKGKVTGHWEAGQKTFVSASSPDLFGFCGDAYFPPMVIRQIIDQIDCGVLVHGNSNSEDRHYLFVQRLRHAIEQQSGAPIINFSIFHGARDAELMQSRFRLWETRALVDKETKIVSWTDKEINLTIEHSYFVHIDGSGQDYVKKKGREWVNTNAEGTSRAAIWSFCSTLHQELDKYSGGAPQLIGIWRKGPAKIFGFWWKGRPYLSGSEVPTGGPVNNVDWFNYRFERCDGMTGKLKSGAARHAKPTPTSSRGT